MSSTHCFAARAVLSHSEGWTPEGVVVVEGGRVRAVLERRVAEAHPTAREAAWTDLGDALLTPGLVNAHAHLELGALRGRTPRGVSMFEWVGAVLEELAALAPGDFAAGVAQGAARLLATGTTAVGDIDASGASLQGLAATGIAGRVYREVLDARDASRTSSARARLAIEVSPGPGRRVLPGVSPHGPHTVSEDLLEAAVECARSEDGALSLHFAESREEERWLRSGEGPFAAVLGPWPGPDALARLEASGASRLPLSLVHANHLAEDELERLAGLGAVLVHCSGTHAFFEREGEPLERWAAAGAVLALGTDSLASNEDLDLRRELAMAARLHPRLEPRVLFEAATRGGARALGLEGEVGQLTPGAQADMVAFEAPTTDLEGALACLVHDSPAVKAVWVSGLER